MKQLIKFLPFLLLAACSVPDRENNTDLPSTNVILLIGDGMGLSAVSTGFYFGDEQSQFSRFRHIGLTKTSSASHKITDSGAAGTALACGELTYNGAIGVDSLKSPVSNTVEILSPLGWSTGLVASSSITHATPASFYAHVANRSMQDEIAAQLLVSDVDFFAGGGIKFLNKRNDGKDLFPLAEERGFLIDTLALAEPGSMKAGQKYGFLLNQDKMPPALKGRGDYLPKATSLALEQLSLNDKGFFLMVEGSQIDWAGHENNVEYTLGEMQDFEKAIKVALDFAERDGNTLVVVTADHETGGFAMTAAPDPESGNNNYNIIGPSYATGGHTATLIPVFAYGPGADRFMGIYEISAVFKKMMEVAGTGE